MVIVGESGGAVRTCLRRTSVCTVDAVRSTLVHHAVAIRTLFPGSQFQALTTKYGRCQAGSTKTNKSSIWPSSPSPAKIEQSVSSVARQACMDFDGEVPFSAPSDFEASLIAGAPASVAEWSSCNSAIPASVWILLTRSVGTRISPAPLRFALTMRQRTLQVWLSMRASIMGPMSTPEASALIPCRFRKYCTVRAPRDALLAWRGS